MENTKAEKTVICIDGYIDKLQSLWSNLETQTQHFSTALIIFLGDYCDRGPDTHRVIDFLLSLPFKFPLQSHVFLSGNHDFAFTAFLGHVPVEGRLMKDTWREYEVSEDREGWYKGEGFEGMHLQGRRWAGEIKVRFNTIKGTEYKGSIYDAAPTFESYGVPHGSAGDVCIIKESALRTAVPEKHKKFLANLVWVHEEKHCKLIAVHAGLEKGKAVVEQLKLLKGKDTSIPKVEALSGRKTVWDIPQELTETIVVSGHHGKLHIEGPRLIIDEGGGFENKPVAAIVLPSMRIVRDTDGLSK